MKQKELCGFYFYNYLLLIITFLINAIFIVLKINYNFYLKHNLKIGNKIIELLYETN